MKENGGQSSGRIGPKTDRDLTNAEKIIFTLRDLGKTVSTAESVTAGGISYGLTRVPGSSKVFRGGVAAYTRDVKLGILGIQHQTLEMGLTTPIVTKALAEAALRIFKSDIALGITGNAGPATDEGPGHVGEIHVCVIDNKGNIVEKTANFAGNRDDVRDKSVTEGLRLLRNFVEDFYITGPDK